MGFWAFAATVLREACNLDNCRLPYDEIIFSVRVSLLEMLNFLGFRLRI